MPGRGKGEAVDNFCHYFKESLSCLTDAFLHPIQKSQNLYLLTYEPPATLLCNSGERSLSVTQVFSVVPNGAGTGRFKVKTHQYSYTLNALGTEIVSYHWHPDESDVRYPHLHIASVPRVHFPTARISVERFINMLIDYYDISPILGESEWRRILKKNNSEFDKMATWK